MASSIYTSRPVVGAANQLVAGFQTGAKTVNDLQKAYYDIRKQRRADTEAEGEEGGYDASGDDQNAATGGEVPTPDGQGGTVSVKKPGEQHPEGEPPLAPVTESALPNVKEIGQKNIKRPAPEPAFDPDIPGPVAPKMPGEQHPGVARDLAQRTQAIPVQVSSAAPMPVSPAPPGPTPSQAPNPQAAYTPGAVDPPGNQLPEGYGAQPVDMNTAFSEGQATNGFLDRIRIVETNGDDGTPSPKGAMGPYQLLPDTINNPGYGVTPITPQEAMDPTRSRQFSSEYLNAMLKLFNGNAVLATAAYNGGPGMVMESMNNGSGASSWPVETQNYITSTFGELSPNAFNMASQQMPVQRPAGGPAAPPQVLAQLQPPQPQLNPQPQPRPQAIPMGGQFGGAVPHVLSYAQGGYVERAI